MFVQAYFGHFNGPFIIRYCNFNIYVCIYAYDHKKEYFFNDLGLMRKGQGWNVLNKQTLHLRQVEGKMMSRYKIRTVLGK